MTEIALDAWNTTANVIRKALGLDSVDSGVRRELPVSFTVMRYGRVQIKIELETERKTP